MMKIGFIGAGKVGFTLGKYFCEHGSHVTGYWSRNPQSALEAAAFTDTIQYDSLQAIAEDNDVLFLTVPDGAIEHIWSVLKKLPIKHKIFCHCSGSHSSRIFSEIAETEAFGYSVHPLFAIHSKYTSYSSLSQALFAVEGDPAQLDTVCALLRAAGNRVQVIAPEHKTQYHAAAVIVSNHTVALTQLGLELLHGCGFPEADARQALLPLLSGTVQNLLDASPVDALTGPVERGDVGTVLGHLRALHGENRELYRLLSAKLAVLAYQKHPTRNDSEMEELLQHEAYDFNDSTAEAER